MAMTTGGSVPNAGTSGANYPAPTPHAAAVSHQVYEAPTSGDGIGAGYGGAGSDTNASGRAGSAVNGIAGDASEEIAKNSQLGNGEAHAIEQPDMGDDSRVVFGSERPHTEPGFGGGNPAALDSLPGLQQGTGYGNVSAPTAAAEKGLDPGATGFSSASGTGNQNAGYDRRVIKATTKTDGGWKSV